MRKIYCLQTYRVGKKWYNLSTLIPIECKEIPYVGDKLLINDVTKVIVKSRLVSHNSIVLRVINEM